MFRIFSCVENVKRVSFHLNSNAIKGNTWMKKELKIFPIMKTKLINVKMVTFYLRIKFVLQILKVFLVAKTTPIPILVKSVKLIIIYLKTFASWFPLS